MARLVSKVVTPKMSVTVKTIHTDDSIEEKVLNIGDVTTLRYIKDNQVVSVTGKVTKFTMNNASNSLSKFEENKKDTFATDVKIKLVVVDASAQYESKVVSVDAREIIEDEGVMNVKKVDVYPSLMVNVTSTYTDGSVDSDDLYPGYTISNIIIMSGTPGTPDITGTFKIGAFLYQITDSVISTTGVILTNEDGSKPFTATWGRIISIDDVYGTIEVNAENFVESIETAVTGSTLQFEDNITVAETVAIPEGKALILDLNGHALELGEPNDTDVPVIENNGDLTITNGSVTGFTVMNNTHATLRLKEDAIINCTAGAVTGAGAIKNYGTTIVDGATINVPFVGSTSDPGGPAGVRNFGNLVFNSGTIESASKRTYAIISTGNVTVEDGEIHGVHGGIAVDGGTAFINDGNFDSTEYYGLYVSNDGSTSDVTVNGGIFSGPNYSVWVGSDDQSAVEALVKIYGGVFMKQLKDQSNVSAGYGTSIYGGKFKVEPPADMIPEGYQVVYNEETEYYEVFAVDSEEA